MNTATQSKILIVDDDEMIRDCIIDALGSWGFVALSAGNVHDAKKISQNEQIDLLITDIHMQGGSGIDLLQFFRVHFPTVPTIVITGFPGEEYIQRIEEMEVDAFLAKPFSNNQIRYTVLKGLEKRLRNIENIDADSLVKDSNDIGLIGTSTYIVQLRKKICSIARSDFPVIIQGPSGTGKEIVANAIHNCSKRRDNPIVAINCAAIPKHLEESEFFGHVKGAFTGAQRDKNGIIAAADNSTLFLDEIGELSPDIQAKLLRVLENGEFLRIGETVPKKVNIRIVTATNRDLKEMIASGTFREDLFFRLGTTIFTKPLSTHKEDIPLIVKHFINVNCQIGSQCPRAITAEAMAYMVNNHWQGNIRELKQTVNLLCHIATGKKRINITDIKSVLEHVNAGEEEEESYVSEKMRVLKEFESDYFIRLLKKYSGNISQAAKASQMHRPNLIKKLKSINIEPDLFRG